MAKQGLIILYTGNGKGKTTAAFGQALRAAGHGLKVCVIQFIKGKWQTGEAKGIAQHGDLIAMHTIGTGFTWEAKDREEVTHAARAGWDLAKDKIMSDRYDMVILDEITYLVTYDIVSEEDVLDLLADRPDRLHIVLTGRAASPGLIAAADTVTEMKEIKHAFKSGVKARKGIEY